MNLKGILSVAGRTDTGKVRSHNEDFLGENLDIGLVALAVVTKVAKSPANSLFQPYYQS